MSTPETILEKQLSKEDADEVSAIVSSILNKCIGDDKSDASDSSPDPNGTSPFVEQPEEVPPSPPHVHHKQTAPIAAPVVTNPDLPVTEHIHGYPIAPIKSSSDGTARHNHNDSSCCIYPMIGTITLGGSHGTRMVYRPKTLRHDTTIAFGFTPALTAYKMPETYHTYDIPDLPFASSSPDLTPSTTSCGTDADDESDDDIVVVPAATAHSPPSHKI